MITKTMVENTWAEDMGQFLYHLDPDTLAHWFVGRVFANGPGDLD